MTGIVLAGGKNRRMGVKKAFLNIGETTIIDSILAVYKMLFDEVIIVTNTPEDYEYCNVKMVKDIVPNCGPLGGIYTGILEAKNPYCFVSACDMPFINIDIIKYIIDIKGYDIVVPIVHGRYEPLFALYSRSCISVLKKQLEDRKLSIKDIFKVCSVKEIQVEEFMGTDEAIIFFTNVNTPEEFKDALIKRENMNRGENICTKLE